MARTIPVNVDVDRAAAAAYETFVTRPAKPFTELTEQSKQKWRDVANSAIATIDYVGADD